MRSDLSLSQLELIEFLSSRKFSDEQISEIRKVLAKYFFEKMTASAEKAWIEKGYNEDTIKNWLNGDY
jgi:hypothetical protein